MYLVYDCSRRIIKIVQYCGGVARGYRGNVPPPHRNQENLQRMGYSPRLSQQ